MEGQQPKLGVGSRVGITDRRAGGWRTRTRSRRREQRLDSSTKNVKRRAERVIQGPSNQLSEDQHHRQFQVQASSIMTRPAWEAGTGVPNDQTSLRCCLRKAHSRLLLLSSHKMFTLERKRLRFAFWVERGHRRSAPGGLFKGGVATRWRGEISIFHHQVDFMY